MTGQTRSRKYERRSCGSAATLRFSNTVESSNSSSDWNERATPALARLTARRLREVDVVEPHPTLGRVNPLSASISDVLPAPFGPIRPVTCARFEREPDVVDGGDRAVAHGQAVDDQGLRGHPAWSSVARRRVGDVGELDGVRLAPLLRAFLMSRKILTHSAATPSL